MSNQLIEPRLARLRALTQMNQRRIFTFEEAIESGFSVEAIAHRTRIRAWVAIAPHVMCAAPVGPMSSLEQLAALVLSSGAHASHQSTLGLEGIVALTEPFHVSVPRTRRNLDRVVLHSSRDLPASDLMVSQLIPATTVERSLIDCVHQYSDHDGRFLITKAIVRRKATIDSLAERAEELRNSRRPGATKTLRLLVDIAPNTSESKNEWEGLAAQMAMEYGLPAPERNYRVDLEHGPRFLDLAWPIVRRGLEYDGYLEHLASMHRFMDDRYRDIDFKNSGWRVDRCNANMLNRDPSRIFEPVLRALEQHAA